MLTLVLPADLVNVLEDALRRAGSREIGGVLMGEHVATDTFAARDVSVHRAGAFASFWRTVDEMLGVLNRFFERTQHDYTRFNYMGEWHSHPSFEPIPSATDHQSMHEIITDASVGAHFVVLVVAKLDPTEGLIGTAHAYFPNGSVERCQLVIERKERK